MVSIDRIAKVGGSKSQQYLNNEVASLREALGAIQKGLDSQDSDALSPVVSAAGDCLTTVTAPSRRADEVFDAQRDQCTLHAARLLAEAKVALRIAGAELKPDVKNLRWGDDVATVRHAMGKPADGEDGHTLFYRENVGRYSALLMLSFVNGHLSGATYSLEEKHSNDNAYLEDFDQLEPVLIEKYGKPYYSGKAWSSSLFKGDPSHYGTAIATGQMQQSSDWNLDRTTIRHLLIGDNFKIHHLIGYRSREFAGAEAAEKSKAAASSL